MFAHRTLLLAGAALIALPAAAQDAPAAQTQSVTPPPIMVAPQPAQPAPAQPAPQMRMAPQSPVVQSVPAEPEAAPEAEAAPSARSERATTTRQARPARAQAPAAPAEPAAETPAPPATAPVTEAPATPPPATAPAPTAEAVPADAAPADASAQTSETQTATTAAPLWPWVLGGLAVIIAGIGALLLMRRRRDETDYVAPPVVVREPVAAREEPRLPVAPAAPIVADPTPQPYAAPVVPIPASAPRHEPEVARVDPLGEAHAEAELAKPEQAEVAAIADAPAPVANRPWLEFGLRPVRAGTNEEEALVDVELTVGNAGDTPARDVRISTFLLADAEGSEMEQLLTERGVDASVPPVTIAPGDGTRVDAHLAVPKGELGRTFNPVVVAEARYTLPDGREGRTAAAFRIGRPAPDAAGVGAIGASRPHLVEDVEAELVGAPEHA
jgi:hypothetical protein